MIMGAPHSGQHQRAEVVGASAGGGTVVRALSEKAHPLIRPHTHLRSGPKNPGSSRLLIRFTKDPA